MPSRQEMKADIEQLLDDLNREKRSDESFREIRKYYFRLSSEGRRVFQECMLDMTRRDGGFAEVLAACEAREVAPALARMYRRGIFRSAEWYGQLLLGMNRLRYAPAVCLARRFLARYRRTHMRAPVIGSLAHSDGEAFVEFAARELARVAERSFWMAPYVLNAFETDPMLLVRVAKRVYELNPQALEAVCLASLDELHRPWRGQKVAGAPSRWHGRPWYDTNATDAVAGELQKLLELSRYPSIRVRLESEIAHLLLRSKKDSVNHLLVRELRELWSRQDDYERTVWGDIVVDQIAARGGEMCFSWLTFLQSYPQACSIVEEIGLLYTPDSNSDHFNCELLRTLNMMKGPEAAGLTDFWLGTLSDSELTERSSLIASLAFSSPGLFLSYSARYWERVIETVSTNDIIAAYRPMDFVEACLRTDALLLVRLRDRIGEHSAGKARRFASCVHQFLLLPEIQGWTCRFPGCRKAIALWAAL